MAQLDCRHPQVVSIEQVPVTWTTADGSEPPGVGDIVRIVDARLTSPEPPFVIRVDRVMTTLWTVGADQAPVTTPGALADTSRVLVIE